MFKESIERCFVELKDLDFVLFFQSIMLVMGKSDLGKDISLLLERGF